MLDAISGGRFDVGFARAFLPHEFRRFSISPDTSVARFREGLEQIELLLTQENVTPPRPVSFVRERHLAAAADAKAAAEILYRLDPHRGFVRVRRPCRPRADVDPGRPAEGFAADLPQGLARRRPSGRRRGDDRLPHVLPRGRKARPRNSAPAVRGLFHRAVRIRRRMDARHVVEGLQRLRRFDQPHEEFHAGKPDRKRRRLGRHAGRDQNHHPPLPRTASANSSTHRCRSISARSISPRRKNRCACSPRK